VCQNVGTLRVEKKIGFEISKAWENYDISAYDKSRKQQLMYDLRFSRRRV
jgi:hypothetical protein